MACQGLAAPSQCVSILVFVYTLLENIYYKGS